METRLVYQMIKWSRIYIFLLPISFVDDCGQYRACMLHDDEDIMPMFSMFIEISKLTCLELYITTADTPTQTYAHPPPFFASSLNLEGLDEYLDETMNLESSFEEIPHPQFTQFLFYYLMICSCHVCFSLLYLWVIIMDWNLEVLVIFLIFGHSLMCLRAESRLKTCLNGFFVMKILLMKHYFNQNNWYK